MQDLQDLVMQWWADADTSSHVAVIVFGSVLVVAMIFSIAGTYMNPARRPHNEVDFRRFAEASLAARAPQAQPANAAARKGTTKLENRKRGEQAYIARRL